MTTGNSSAYFNGQRAPATIVNFASAGGTGAYYANPNESTFTSSITKAILSGALTSNTLKTLLSVSGAGALKFLSLFTKDATSRTLRLKLTIDGVAVYDATSAAIAGQGCGISAVGGIQYSGAAITGIALENMPFYVSLLVEVASSLSETDKIAIATLYETR